MLFNNLEAKRQKKKRNERRILLYFLICIQLSSIIIWISKKYSNTSHQPIEKLNKFGNFDETIV